ncbi:hypothetical protein P5673_027960 [Acropora cervicornis]|uniref:Uncharacterized protein n=1 Tax=Acropora cervicornis TaxID=6130 RepID=A0AAD9PY29_ACRCE|nr:hypothetical protein P5673_027960 [Acropora cervicornis]
MSFIWWPFSTETIVWLSLRMLEVPWCPCIHNTHRAGRRLFCPRDKGLLL